MRLTASGFSLAENAETHANTHCGWRLAYFFISPIMDFWQAACVVALVLKLRKEPKQRRRHRYWVHPLTDQRHLKGYFCKMYNDVRQYPDKFFNYYRMSIGTYDKLLQAVGQYLKHEDTTFRMAISPEERLSVTLR